MPLDQDIIEMVKHVIEEDLAASKVPKERIPKLIKTWRCEHAYDFLYGHRAGYYKGLAEGMTVARHGRRLLPNEDDQVFELTKMYASRLRRYFAYYKTKNKQKLDKHLSARKL